MANLKKCPFCGNTPSEGVFHSSGNVLIVYVRCSFCHVEMKTAYSPGVVNKPKNAEATAKRLATAKWNRRAGDMD